MERLDRRTRERVLRVLDRLAEMEYGDVRRVRGRDLMWRLRVGDWRVLYRYEPEEGFIRVLGVRHRREAYRR